MAQAEKLLEAKIRNFILYSSKQMRLLDRSILPESVAKEEFYTRVGFERN